MMGMRMPKHVELYLNDRQSQLDGPRPTTLLPPHSKGKPEAATEVDKGFSEEVYYSLG
jgi:hypothetical protein